MNFLYFVFISYLVQLFVDWLVSKEDYGHRQLYAPSALYGALVGWELRFLGLGWALSAGLVAVAARMAPGAVRLFICAAAKCSYKGSLWWATLIVEVIAAGLLAMGYYNSLQK